MDLTTLLPIAAFGMFAAGVWALLDFFSARKSRSEERLEEFKDPSIRRKRKEDSVKEKKKAEAMAKVLERATPALARALQPKTERDADQLKLRLAQAGFRNDSAPTIFLGLKIIGLAVKNA